jgi:hypothetical protein
VETERRAAAPGFVDKPRSMLGLVRVVDSGI